MVTDQKGNQDILVAFNDLDAVYHDDYRPSNSRSYQPMDAPSLNNAPVYALQSMDEEPWSYSYSNHEEIPREDDNGDENESTKRDWHEKGGYSFLTQKRMTRRNYPGVNWMHPYVSVNAEPMLINENALQQPGLYYPDRNDDIQHEFHKRRGGWREKGAYSFITAKRGIETIPQRDLYQPVRSENIRNELHKRRGWREKGAYAFLSAKRDNRNPQGPDFPVRYDDTGNQLDKRQWREKGAYSFIKAKRGQGPDELDGPRDVDQSRNDELQDNPNNFGDEDLQMSEWYPTLRTDEPAMVDKRWSYPHNIEVLYSRRVRPKAVSEERYPDMPISMGKRWKHPENMANLDPRHVRPKKISEGWYLPMRIDIPAMGKRWKHPQNMANLDTRRVRPKKISEGWYLPMQIDIPAKRWKDPENMANLESRRVRPKKGNVNRIQKRYENLESSSEIMRATKDGASEKYDAAGRSQTRTRRSPGVPNSPNSTGDEERTWHKTDFDGNFRRRSKGHQRLQNTLRSVFLRNPICVWDNLCSYNTRSTQPPITRGVAGRSVSDEGYP